MRAQFNKIVRQTRTALGVERIPPLLIPPVVMAGGFLGASWLDIWTHIPHDARPYVLAGYALAAVASPLLVKGKSIFVSKKEALRHLDNQVGHGKDYPASALNARAPDNIAPESRAAWDLQQEKLLKKWVPQFQPHKPSPVIARPWAYALAASALLAVGSGVFAGDQRIPRLQEAFNFTAPPVVIPPPDVRAWITPPKGFKGEKAQYLKEGQELTPVHKSSVLNVSVIGTQPKVILNGQEVKPLKTLVSGEGHQVTYQYAPVELNEGHNEFHVEGGASWVIDVKPDMAPKAHINAAGLSGSEEGGLVLKCTATDDYAVRSGTAVLGLSGSDAEQDQILPSARLPSFALSGGHFCEDQPAVPVTP